MTQLTIVNCKFCESGECRLTVCIERMKGKVVGHVGLDEHDVHSVQVQSGYVEAVSHSTYFGFNISREVDITVE